APDVERSAFKLSNLWEKHSLRSLIGNRRSRSVDFGKTDCELLVIRQRSILKDTDRQGLSQLDGRISVAAPVDSGVNAVAKGDVVRKLVELAVDGHLSRVSPSIGQE